MNASVVLLSSDSRESLQKAASWRAAARRLGISVRAHPDRTTKAILACTDHAFVQAAWLCQTHRIPGPSPYAAGIAGSKALLYEFLRSRGFDMLFFLVPMRPADLRVPFDRPLIVKPERGSGSHSVSPWGYRIYDSMADFRRFLRRRRLEDAFFEQQWRDAGRAGGYVLMEYVDAPVSYGVVAVSSAQRVERCTEFSATVDPTTLRIQSVVYGERVRGMARVLAMLREVASLGLRRTVLMAQCVVKRGKLYLIDLNFRTAALFDRLNAALGTAFYEKALEFILGARRSVGFDWPAPRAAALRTYAKLAPGSYRAQFAPGWLPLVDRFTISGDEAYDYALSHPAFGLLCRNRSEFELRSAAALNKLRIETLR